MATVKQLVDRLPNTQEFIALMERIDGTDPDPEDVRTLRAVFQEHTELAEATVYLTDQTFDAMFRHMAGAQVVSFEALRALRLRRQNELGHEYASELEKRLIEAVVLAWFRYVDTERRYTAIMSESQTLTFGAYWDKRLSAAQRRYFRAVETLVRVRRLCLPAMQVNIGERQINQVNTAT